MKKTHLYRLKRNHKIPRKVRSDNMYSTNHSYVGKKSSLSDALDPMDPSAYSDVPRYKLLTCNPTIPTYVEARGLLALRQV